MERETDNLSAIFKPFVQTVLDPQHFTNLMTFTTCYGDSFTIIYVEDVRTSQETRLWASMACY
jgi:hypothetical protein